MKNRPFLIFIFSCMLSFHAWAQQGKLLISDTTDPAYYKQLNSHLPYLELTNNGKVIEGMQTTIEQHKYVAVVLFNPTCDHCEILGSTLAKNAEHLEDILFLFVAGERMDENLVKRYITKTGIDALPNKYIGNDGNFIITRLYEFKALPQVNVYTNGLLAKIFKQEMSIEELLALTANAK